MSQWLTEEYKVNGRRVAHITPVGDSQPHNQVDSCPCKPRLVLEGGSTLFIHNSFDGREAAEWAKEILKGGTE